MSETSTPESAIPFPCDFPIKVVGKKDDQFEQTVLAIFKKHFPNLAEGSLKQRPSQQGNYLSLTVTVYAENKKQLDDLYQELSKCPEVVMAL
jgi:putative lipoic acid-binding regulatory protein